MQDIINNNATFCYQSKEKVLSPLLTLLEECKCKPKKIKTENLIDDNLGKCSSDESDNAFNDETESDNEKDNDESNKKLVKR